MTSKPSKPCILLVAPPDSYRVAPYVLAAQKLGIDIKIASRGEHSLVNEIASGIHINLDSPETAIETIIGSADRYQFRGIVAADDKATEIAATVAKALNLPHNPPTAVHLTRWKHKARELLQRKKIPVPKHWVAAIKDILADKMPEVEFPCVAKPLNLSASRGVIRCNNPEELKNATRVIAGIVSQLEELDSKSTVLIEKFIPGKEIALEAVLQEGKLVPIALFDKPDPLDGPFFEETYYVTPSRLNTGLQQRIYQIVESACEAYGLNTGPIHAELRLDGNNIYVIEIAARTIGGECAQLVEFASQRSLESIVIEYAMGINSEPPTFDTAAGVMMIPTPRSGILRRVEGVLNAQKIENIVSVNIAVREGHELVALPEGASYLGFIFAVSDTAEKVEQSLRDAYRCLKIVIDPLWKISGSLNPDDKEKITAG